MGGKFGGLREGSVGAATQRGTCSLVKQCVPDVLPGWEGILDNGCLLLIL